jgi:MFS family permease
MRKVTFSRISLLYLVTFVNHALVSFGIMFFAPIMLHGHYFSSLNNFSSSSKVLIFGLLLSCKPLTEAVIAACFYRLKLSSPHRYLQLFLLLCLFSMLIFSFGLFYHHLVMIFIAQLFFGVGCAAIFVIQVLLAELSMVSRRTLVFNFMEWSVGLGMSLGPIVGAYLARWGGGWHPATPYLVAAIAVFVLFIASLSLFPKSQQPYVRLSVDPKSGQAEQSKAFYYCLLSWFCFMLGWQGYFHWFPVLALNHYHFNHIQLNRIYVFIGVFSLIFQLSVVSFFTRYAIHRVVLYLSIPVIGVSIILMPLLRTPMQLYIVSVIYIVAISFLMPFWKAYLSLLAWQTQQKLFSSMTFVTAVCALLVTALGGLLGARSLVYNFILFGALILVALLLVIMAEKRVGSQIL